MIIKGQHSYCAGQISVKFSDSGENLIIGDYCSIGVGLDIFLGGEHRIDWISTYPFSVMLKGSPTIENHRTTKGSVIIGNDVWIGDNVTVKSGVIIGDGAVIGSCSVITKNIGDYEIWAGNPARFIRKRFDEEAIKLLKEIRWWEWTEEEIIRVVPILSSGDIKNLKGFYEQLKNEKIVRENDNDYCACL